MPSIQSHTTSFFSSSLRKNIFELIQSVISLHPNDFRSSKVGLASFATAIPSEYQHDVLFRRAVNDKCNTPVGKGTCQPTSECSGVSYPNRCPNNAADVKVRLIRVNNVFQTLADFSQQCCVSVPCEVPGVYPGSPEQTGICRSVKNNGCQGGTFISDHCPGNSDIKCCVRVPRNLPDDPSTSDNTPPMPNTEPPVTPPSDPPNGPPAPYEEPPLSERSMGPAIVDPDLCSPAATDRLLFEVDLATFLAAKRENNPPCFDWSDDGCSCSWDHPGAFDFVPSCARHDFGYRNTATQNRFEAMKERIDQNFEKDLYSECDKFVSLQNWDCHTTADIYVSFVSGSENEKRDETSRGLLNKRECSLSTIWKAIF